MNKVRINGELYELTSLNGYLTTKRGDFFGQFRIIAIQGSERYEIELEKSSPLYEIP